MQRLLSGILLILLLLTSCKQNSDPAPSGDTHPDLIPPLTLEEADQVVGTFLQAWELADYATMYAMISPNSRDAYDEETFALEYDTAAILMRLNTLDTQMTGSLRQGTSAEIQYNVTFHSDIFGDIVDENRMMTLIETSEGWRIAWSRADIFRELENGGQFSLTRTMPSRGNIYDRNGNVLVDQSGRVLELYIVQDDITDVQACITELARIMEEDRATIEAKFSNFARDILFDVGEIDPNTYQTEAQVLLDMCDVGDDERDIRSHSTRRYVDAIAPHIVGYVGPIRPDQAAEYERLGYPEDALIGQEGIEASYESYLAGTIGKRLDIVDVAGRLRRTLAEIPAAPGQSIYLTIDHDLQAATQQAFEDAYTYSWGIWGAQSPGAAAVVLDVNTGEVLAMVSYPTFDPNVFNPYSEMTGSEREAAIEALQNNPRTPLLNRPTSGLYPLGSVFKIVSTAAGLESGVYNANTPYSCGGRWYGQQFGDALDYRLDWLEGGHGYVTTATALTYSCDPFYYQLAANLYNEGFETILTEFAHQMGLGVPTEQTDIEEQVGQIPDNETSLYYNGRPWHIADAINLVIGQGPIQITPLQVARMVAGVANGGTLYRPQLVLRAQLMSAPPLYEMEPEAESEFGFAPETLELIRDSMCDVTTTPSGTANYMYNAWYDLHGEDIIVCGKTGTAQTGGTYTRPQGWFAAFAPDDPEIAVVVIVENSCEGSEVASPIVARIIETYYHMPTQLPWPNLWISSCLGGE